MRIKFQGSEFTGDRTYGPGDVAEVDDNIGAEFVKEGRAEVTVDEITPIPTEPTPPPAPASDETPEEKKPAPAKPKK